MNKLYFYSVTDCRGEVSVNSGEIALEILKEFFNNCQDENFEYEYNDDEGSGILCEIFYYRDYSDYKTSFDEFISELKSNGVEGEGVAITFGESLLEAKANYADLINSDY